MKGKKLFKSQKLAKSGKELSNSKNLSNFGIIKAKLKFLTFDTEMIFNYLWLAFIKALILYNFNLKYYIWIEIDILGHVIDRIPS